MIVMNSTNSNSKVSHLFPELPPTRTSSCVGGGFPEKGKWFERLATRGTCVLASVAAAAVRWIGQPLLRLPALEFTIILMLAAILLFAVI